jgi:hypothetical protein
MKDAASLGDEDNNLCLNVKKSFGPQCGVQEV